MHALQALTNDHGHSLCELQYNDTGFTLSWTMDAELPKMLVEHADTLNTAQEFNAFLNQVRCELPTACVYSH